jgi:hypothetical protein
MRSHDDQINGLRRGENFCSRIAFHYTRLGRYRRFAMVWDKRCEVPANELEIERRHWEWAHRCQ